MTQEKTQTPVLLNKAELDDPISDEEKDAVVNVEDVGNDNEDAADRVSLMITTRAGSHYNTKKGSSVSE